VAKIWGEIGSRKIKRQKDTRTRTIKLDSESMDMMNQQLQAFREKFGREAGPGDPVFSTPMPTLPAVSHGEVRGRIDGGHSCSGDSPRNHLCTSKNKWPAGYGRESMKALS
jgi:hypothetical protein